MKPNFALVLSFDGIGLLHRAPDGWHMVGEVALDASDLASALAELRRTATGLDSEGLRSKLVIPNEQIRYLTLPAPMRGTDMAAHVAACLDGATPYDVADLRFDWVSVGDQLHVAAVAVETLDEASSFAAEHGFGPVSYVAIPPADTFPGEPFFGLTPEAAALIRPGDRLLRDTHAIRILGPADRPVTAESVTETVTEAVAETTTEATAPPETTQPEAAEPRAEAAPATAVPPAPPAASAAPEAPLTAEVQAGRFSLIEPPVPEVTEALAADLEMPDNEASTTAQAPDQPGPVDPVVTADDQDSPPEDAPPLPRFSTRRDRAEPPLSARKPIVAELPPLPELNAEGWTGLPGDLWGTTDTETEEDAATARPTPPLVARNNGAARDPDDAAALTPAPFISPPAPEPATQGGTDAGLTGALLARLACKGTPDPEAEAETTTPKPRKAARTKVKPTDSERQRLTVFGARAPEGKAAAVGGKPRYLGVVLTGILLLFLAAVGAWSAMFSDTGLRGLFGQTPPEIADAVATPETAPQTPAEPVAMTQDIQQATPAPLPQTETATAPRDPIVADIPTAADTPAPLPTDDLQPDLAQRPPPTAQEARQATLSSYAATGIWQIAPEQPEAPVSQSLDTLYLASIDPSLQNLDAVALPDISRALSDVRPEAQSNPAAPGKQFDLDERGLVIATPEGAETPEGVIVYSGRPPLTPPGIPTRFAQTPSADTQPEPDLAGVRPRLRPETLIESNERATLGGLSRNELAGLRPRARPETLAAVALALREADAAEVEADEADAQDTGTDQAIATSLKPLARPRDLTTGNDSAAPAQQRVASAAALAPQRNAAPQIPSSASVAQQATVRGAINLRQVNLIGVYGQPSNRRALVRLSNGRYQKVQVGDRLDGGQVRAIGENELSYVKNNRAIVLTMPNG